MATLHSREVPILENQPFRNVNFLDDVGPMFEQHQPWLDGLCKSFLNCLEICSALPTPSDIQLARREKSRFGALGDGKIIEKRFEQRFVMSFQRDQVRWKRIRP
jgi:hypothetical protein